MSDSFNGTTMRVRVAGTFSDHTQTDFHVHHIPGGDVNYLDYGGAKERVIQLPLHFTSMSSAMTFRALKGTSGSLVCVLGTVTGATLTDFAINQVVPDTSGGAKAVLATATWTVP